MYLKELTRQKEKIPSVTKLRIELGLQKTLEDNC